MCFLPNFRCLLTDRDEMCNSYRGPSIDASYQVSLHFGQAVSEEKIFFNRPIRNKNYLWRPCLLTDRDKMYNLYRGPSIDASYQVSVQLVKRFQREDFNRIYNYLLQILDLFDETVLLH